MPVTLVPPPFDPGHPSVAHWPSRAPGKDCDPLSRELTIGLLNNMPDSAVEATERQFISLLNAAAGEICVRLVLCCLPSIPRGDQARERLDQHYVSIESLWDAGLDGLIVTGREPLSSNLREEPYWNSFVQVLDWARDNTCSTIWSCLAAHAAVLHMDNIERVRSAQKQSGIFECTRVSDHPITASVAARFRLPHSRWNGLPESELVRCGYQILSSAGSAGVDAFIRKQGSLFLFFQGHPEYQPETILLEYRRDVLRYLRGDSSKYPGIPRGYFDSTGERELLSIQREVDTRPTEDTLTRLAAVFATLRSDAGWHTTATTIYRNWLETIATEKERREQKKDAAATTPIPGSMDPPAELESFA